MGGFLIFTGFIYFFGILIAYWIRRVPFYDPKRESPTTHKEQNDRSFWFILPGMIIAFFISPVEALWFPHWLPQSGWMQVVGIILVLFSVMLFIWARRTIRRNYSGQLRVTDTQELIQSGPSRCIRHPAYLSYILMSLGVGIGFASLIGICAVPLILVPGFVYRIRVEETLLVNHFGQRYLDYASHTSRLVPRIW
jgi:protein-S-isoprenylcysteine O-methyltransferase Ste14